MSAIKNWSTEVSEERTVGEIIGLLSSKGARTVHIEYDEKQRPMGVEFIIGVLDVPIPFRLPCDFEGVFKYMAKTYKDDNARRRFERNPESMQQSRRAAWRIIKNWVEAQMAIIDAGQASMAQVFLPYIKFQAEGGITMYDKFLKQISSQKTLSSGEKGII